MENTSVVAEKNCLKNLHNQFSHGFYQFEEDIPFFGEKSYLGEEVPRCRFFEGATFTDVVKEVLKRVHVLVFST